MKLAIGTAQFGEDYGISNTRKGIPDREIKEIFSACDYKKIFIFDTALSYKNSLNKIKKNIAKKNKFEIIYKVLIKSPIDKKKFYTKVNIGIKKLKNQKISILIHDSNEFLSLNKNQKNKILDLLVNLKKEKKIHRYGFSVYNLKEAISLTENYSFDILQIPINLFNQEFINKKFIRLLKINKIELHVRSIFLQGLVFLKENEIKKKIGILPPQIKKFFFDFRSNEEKIFESLNFIKQLKFVDKIIVGISSKNEFDQILSIYQKKLKKINYFKRYKILKKKYINPSMWSVKSNVN